MPSARSSSTFCDTLSLPLLQLLYEGGGFKLQFCLTHLTYITIFLHPPILHVLRCTIEKNNFLIPCTKVKKYVNVEDINKAK